MNDFESETVAKIFFFEVLSSSVIIKASFVLESPGEALKNTAAWLLSPDLDLIPQTYDLGLVTFKNCPSDF